MNELSTMTSSDIFPEPFMEILEEISIATSTPQIMPMAGFLGMVSGCLGKNCFYESKEGYQIAGNIFLSLVAGSGRNKTGALKPFIDAIARYQKKSGIVIKTKDFTSAGLRNKFQNSDCGILGHFNELSGMFALLNRSPQFKENLIDAYDVQDWACLRADKEIIIDQVCLTILGTIQPRVFVKIVRKMGYADGFLARFLPILVPASDELPDWNEQGIEKKTNLSLDAIVHHALNICDYYGGKPVIFQPSPGARQAYGEWRKNLKERQKPKVEMNFYREVVGKITGQVLKLAISQHVLEELCTGKKSKLVSADAMNRAICLGEYFLSQHLVINLASAGNSKPTNDQQRGLLEAIVECRSSIVDGVLGTGIITAAYNNLNDGNISLSDMSVGRLLKITMHFESKRTASGLKGILITEDEVSRIEVTLNNVDAVFGL